MLNIDGLNITTTASLLSYDGNDVLFRGVDLAGEHWLAVFADEPDDDTAMVYLAVRMSEQAADDTVAGRVSFRDGLLAGDKAVLATISWTTGERTANVVTLEASAIEDRYLPAVGATLGPPRN